MSRVFLDEPGVRALWAAVKSRPGPAPGADTASGEEVAEALDEVFGPLET